MTELAVADVSDWLTLQKIYCGLEQDCSNLIIIVISVMTMCRLISVVQSSSDPFLIQFVIYSRAR